MNRPKLTARELCRRYRQGERNFDNTDLSGESLRGLNLRGIDLSGANLSHTDLRGTNLTDAKLIGAEVCGAKTGVLRRWVVIKVIVALAVGSIPGWTYAEIRRQGLLSR
jgi:Pentapeptide repeats (8 copies)